MLSDCRGDQEVSFVVKAKFGSIIGRRPSDYHCLPPPYVVYVSPRPGRPRSSRPRSAGCASKHSVSSPQGLDRASYRPALTLLCLVLAVFVLHRASRRLLQPHQSFRSIAPPAVPSLSRGSLQEVENSGSHFGNLIAMNFRQVSCPADRLFPFTGASAIQPSLSSGK